jgi:HAD superfamily hydrolase (TIGR01549 family)
MRSIRAVLFDAGGTLIHLDGERICRAAGLPWSRGRFAEAEANATARVRAWILQNPRSTDAERFPLFFDAILSGLALGTEEERVEATRRIAAEHARANLWSRAGEDAAETLEALHARGYRLGVISNADGRVRRLLEDAGLASRLDLILDSAEVGIEKPHPGIFLAATRRLGLEPADCAYVGDIYDIDVVGARAAGMEPVLIGRCPAPEDVRRVALLRELLELFPATAGNCES